MAECQVFCAQWSWHSGAVFIAGDGNAVRDPSQSQGSFRCTEKDWHTWTRRQRQEQLGRRDWAGARAVGPGNPPMSPMQSFVGSFHSLILGEVANPLLCSEVRDRVQGCPISVQV